MQANDQPKQVLSNKQGRGRLPFWGRDIQMSNYFSLELYRKVSIQITLFWKSFLELKNLMLMQKEAHLYIHYDYTVYILLDLLPQYHPFLRASLQSHPNSLAKLQPYLSSPSKYTSFSPVTEDKVAAYASVTITKMSFSTSKVDISEWFSSVCLQLAGLCMNINNLELANLGSVRFTGTTLVLISMQSP